MMRLLLLTTLMACFVLPALGQTSTDEKSASDVGTNYTRYSKPGIYLARIQALKLGMEARKNADGENGYADPIIIVAKDGKTLIKITADETNVVTYSPKEATFWLSWKPGQVISLEVKDYDNYFRGGDDTLHALTVRENFLPLSGRIFISDDDKPYFKTISQGVSREMGDISYLDFEAEFVCDLPEDKSFLATLTKVKKDGRKAWNLYRLLAEHALSNNDKKKASEYVAKAKEYIQLHDNGVDALKEIENLAAKIGKAAPATKPAKVEESAPAEKHDE